MLLLEYLRVLLLMGSALAIPLTTGQITIIGPLELKESFKSSEGIIVASPALFGMPAYDVHFVGKVQIINNENEFACEVVPDNFFQSNPLDDNTKMIALIPRGNCSFVKKIENCQRAGAKGVIVYDSVDSGITSIMSDDGSGHVVSVPSFLIIRKNGLILESWIINHTDFVEIEIVWGLPHLDDRVEWVF